MSEQLFEHYKYHADDAEPEIGYHCGHIRQCDDGRRDKQGAFECPICVMETIAMSRGEKGYM